MARDRKPRDDDDDAPRKKKRPADDENEDDAPRKKTQAVDEDEDEDDKPDEGDDAPKKKARRKRKSSGTASKIIFTSVVVGGIITFLLVVSVRVFSPLGVDSDMLTYLPDDTVGVEGILVEELVPVKKLDDVVPAFKSSRLFPGIGGIFAAFLKPAGIEDKDVNRFIVGKVAAGAWLDPTDKSLWPRGEIAVIKFKSAISADDIYSKSGRRKSRNAARRIT